MVVISAPPALTGSHNQSQTALTGRTELGCVVRTCQRGLREGTKPLIPVKGDPCPAHHTCRISLPSATYTIRHTLFSPSLRSINSYDAAHLGFQAATNFLLIIHPQASHPILKNIVARHILDYRQVCKTTEA
ncbi:hypothetical protein J3459_014265 [Metarhizium acridum]|nr:hypothetical protein J3459_014265 [Metarhizium acridum]